MRKSTSSSRAFRKMASPASTAAPTLRTVLFPSTWRPFREGSWGKSWILR